MHDIYYYWPKFPVRLQEALFLNTRDCVSDETRERNRCYMIGMLAVYKEQGTIDQDTHSFALSAVNAVHLSPTIRKLWAS